MHLPVILGCRLASDLVEFLLLLAADNRRRLYDERTGRRDTLALEATSGDDDTSSDPDDVRLVLMISQARYNRLELSSLSSNKSSFSSVSLLLLSRLCSITCAA